jgi:hypothetical protein
MKKEIWNDIPNYEGLYQVSNLGQVKSLPKTWIANKGCIRKHNGLILKAAINSRGYYSVMLNKNGKSVGKNVHQLIAMAFLNHIPCGHKLVVDHINNNKLDNRIENLQIITQRENSFKTNNIYTSKFKGVHLKKDKYKDKIYTSWVAQIQINGINNYLGSFKTEMEAHNAYQNALKNV